MKFNTSISTAAFGANVAALLSLVVFRDTLQKIMTGLLGFNDPGKFLDGSLYVLIGTCLIFVYKKLMAYFPQLLAFLHPGNAKLNLMYDTLTGIGSKVSGLTDQIGQVEQRVAAMEESVRKDFKNVNTNLASLDGKIDKLESSKEAKDKDRETLQKIRRNKMTFIAKLSPELQRFAVYKANSFIEFVLAIHSIGFYTTDSDGMRIDNPRLDMKTIEEDIYCQAMKVKREGDSIMGEEFTALFYEQHVPRLDKYIAYIGTLLKATDNYKHARFQEESEKFLSEFLEELHHSYIDFKEGARAGGGAGALFDNCRG